MSKKHAELRNLLEAAEEAEDARLIAAIDITLGEIVRARLEARSHDEEIAQLGEETRRLIGKMQRDLNLKAA